MNHTQLVAVSFELMMPVSEFWQFLRYGRHAPAWTLSPVVVESDEIWRAVNRQATGARHID